MFIQATSCLAEATGTLSLQDTVSVLDKVYIVCGRKKDRIKAIYREKDGIVLLYKRLTGSGNYKRPHNQDEGQSIAGSLLQFAYPVVKSAWHNVVGAKKIRKALRKQLG